MKIDGNEIRPGNVIEHQGRLWRAIKTQHVKPGKGGAGTKLNERFRSSESVERVRLDQKENQSFMPTATRIPSWITRHTSRSPWTAR